MCSTVTKRRNIGIILAEYRRRLSEGRQPLDIHQFTAALNQPLRFRRRAFSPHQVLAWHHGRAVPSDFEITLLWMSARKYSWQRRLAADLRAAKRPRSFTASSRFARSLLGQPDPPTTIGPPPPPERQ